MRLVEILNILSQELQILESLSNHVQAKGATREDQQANLVFDKEN